MKEVKKRIKNQKKRSRVTKNKGETEVYSWRERKRLDYIEG